MYKKILLSSIILCGLNIKNLCASVYDELQAVKANMHSMEIKIDALEKRNQYLETNSQSSENDNDISKSSDNSELEERVTELEEDLADLSEKSSGDNLKFSVDFRTSVDNLNYKMSDGSKKSNDAFLSNRLWLNMGYKANDNVSFHAQIAYNKAFGARTIQGNSNFESFDWISNENAYDDILRVRTAYFFYRNDTFFDLDIPWTFSIGRRPSTGGHFINFREDDQAASPSAHSVNVEFDGMSSKFTLSKEYGTYLKFCAGRGFSNASAKFNYTPFSTDDNSTNIDLLGLIFVPYNDGQYQIFSQVYYANNLVGMTSNGTLERVGGLSSATLAILISGIGDEWSDYLDDTTFFASFAASITNPSSVGNGMLGSKDDKFGVSAWYGLNMPSLLSDDGSWGVEYNSGSKFWRSITYAEDTNIGSKIAARGDAYELYFTEYLVEESLSMQLRATYIDYAYSGSNSFFGQDGTPNKIDELNDKNVVDTASDIRVYLRYKY